MKPNYYIKFAEYNSYKLAIEIVDRMNIQWCEQDEEALVLIFNDQVAFIRVKQVLKECGLTYTITDENYKKDSEAAKFQAYKWKFVFKSYVVREEAWDLIVDKGNVNAFTDNPSGSATFEIWATDDNAKAHLWILLQDYGIPCEGLLLRAEEKTEIKCSSPNCKAPAENNNDKLCGYHHEAKKAKDLLNTGTPLTYQTEIWPVSKDLVYEAIRILKLHEHDLERELAAWKELKVLNRREQDSQKVAIQDLNKVRDLLKKLRELKAP